MLRYAMLRYAMLRYDMCSYTLGEMGDYEMKGKKGQVIFVVILCVLFPYIMTLVVSGRVPTIFQKTGYSGKEVVFAADNTKEGSTQDSHTTMDLEEYLIGLVAAQIPGKYEEEAIKAQAIIARTSLYQRFGNDSAITEDSIGMEYFTLSDMKQIWGEENFSEYYHKIESCISSTFGMVMTYEGEYIQPLYHMASAGMTREDTSNTYPYLKSVNSQIDSEAEGYLQMKIMSKEGVVEAINTIDPSKQIKVEDLLSTVQVIEKDSSGYIVTLQIGTHTFSGTAVAKALGLSSHCMTIEEYEDNVRVIGKGIGHGYGLSQFGANEMAKKGKLAQEILSYYYQGISITKVS